jgi:hypothetical protein
VPNLEGEALERSRGQRERGQQLGVAVALHDLRRRRLRLEPEPLARQALDLWVDRRVVPHRAGELSDPDTLESSRNPTARAVELERPDRELEAERRRLGMDTVRAADRQREPVLLCSRGDRLERSIDSPQDDLARGAHLERERRVDHVRGGEPVVEPAPGGPELARDRVDECGQVVMRLLFDLGHAGRGRNRCLRPDLTRRLRRDDSDLRPRIERGELDLEPALELALVRPDPGHLRSRVARDHSFDCTVRTCR